MCCTLLVLQGSIAFGQTTSWRDTIRAPSGKFQVLQKSSQLPDNVIEELFWLQDVSTKDTIRLMKARRHDLPTPNFFWVQDNYLVFEERSYRRNSRIHLMNLSAKKIEFTTRGMIPHRENHSKSFFDKENAILIYFVSNTDNIAPKTSLMKLSVLENMTEKIMTFSVEFDYEYPIVTLDPRTRRLTVQYTDVVSGETQTRIVGY